MTDDKLVEMVYHVLDDRVDYTNDKLYGVMLFLNSYIEDRDFNETLREFLEETGAELSIEVN